MAPDSASTTVKTSVVCDSGELALADSCGISFSRDRHVQGAIELRLKGVLILGQDEVDTIDALWSLLLTYLENFIAGGQGTFSFPERRFTLVLKRMPGGAVAVKFTNEGIRRSVVLSEKSALRVLTSGAVEFFSAVLRCSPKDEWSYRRDLNTAVRLREELSGIE
ncbi:hypothetical protein [Streptomyces anandii]|uniref:hypothetical protein n=1 Tax=Streptomyces anandii TaxID=285454 RepID=UPI0037BDB402